MATSNTLRHVPLDGAHRALGGQMAPFAGWEMPIQYRGIVEEVRAVRSHAGVFDVSHMGRLFVDGAGAEDLLRAAFTYDAARVAIGHGHYNLLCDEDGGILDDPYLYRLGPRRWLVVGNAARYEDDVRWIVTHRAPGLDLVMEDRQAETVMLALQGPEARAIFAEVVRAHPAPRSPRPQGERGQPDAPAMAGDTADVLAIPKRGCRAVEWEGGTVLVSRTGYTGEDGFELIAGVETGQRLWGRLVEAGVTPCGLGARDVLRLEAALALYGNDIDTTTNPFEAGLGWVVSLDGERAFVGRAALERERGTVTRRLSCLRATGRGVLRHGYPVLAAGAPVSELTSGTFSPTLGTAIGMAYLPVELATPGTDLEVDVRGRRVPVTVVKRPFYRGGA